MAGAAPSLEAAVDRRPMTHLQGKQRLAQPAPVEPQRDTQDDWDHYPTQGEHDGAQNSKAQVVPHKALHSRDSPRQQTM